jgi:predicted transcriptional regulator
MNNIGLKIRKVRITNSMDLDEFSNIIDVSKEDLLNFENNVSDIPIDIFRKITELFDINANWLLFENETMLRNHQKISNISNSTVVGANVSDNDVSIHHTMDLEEITEIIKHYNSETTKTLQEKFDSLTDTINKLQEQNENLIEVINKLMDETKNSPQ